ncbi:hypothetical protein DAMA08_017280 [Martiniozyma asiatica (nom. inval.)]|nr:hypothetical protein DAMA08_017280 [Martiniozyma asiatica]
MYHMYVMNQSSVITGVQLLPYVITALLTGMSFNEKIYRKIGLKNLTIASCLICIVGNYLSQRISYKVHNSFWKSEFVAMILFGIGGSTYFNIYFNLYFPNVPLHLQGVATGIYQSLAQVGFTIGTAVVTTTIGTIKPAITEAMKQHFNSKFLIFKYVGYGVLGVIFLISPSISGIDEEVPRDESDAKFVEYENKSQKLRGIANLTEVV